MIFYYKGIKMIHLVSLMIFFFSDHDVSVIIYGYDEHMENVKFC